MPYGVGGTFFFLSPKQVYNMNITDIDKKLDTLRKEWVKGSPAMKKYIESRAKLLKEVRKGLENRAEKEIRDKEKVADLFSS